MARRKGKNEKKKKALKPNNLSWREMELLNFHYICVWEVIEDGEVAIVLAKRTTAFIWIK
jgi:hypothetical protein